ncbi:diaminopimelate epimerase [Xanthovirga aplysinae]|uniref:diaminopimelate epimerase n=1 Tax=Xanthovirga aplysinae TaxID=2529853 RepID=UPI0012BC0828|nr:diaminopimelate epimerase [Xanthovirga aplysinae]MTI32643.1 diaminopimelate epimerase [Xanthovirga aplysinae]
MSKTVNFYKYQGTGNDFVMIDNREHVFDPKDHQSVQKLCDRKFGIGADGLILIQSHEVYDFEMIYFNADASQSMCGNGARCAVQFARFLGIISDQTTFLAIDGVHKAFAKEDLIHLKMGDVKEVNHYDEDMFIDTGSPHHIRFVDDLKTYDVYEKGKEVRYGQPYGQKGTNVNFVESLNDQEVFVRTYERGVENETLSCGTGVTAVSLAMSYKGYQSPVCIQTPGGDLQVSFQKKGDNVFEEIYLIGPAKQVFQGKITI